jgi:hypothetical protein
VFEEYRLLLHEHNLREIDDAMRDARMLIQTKGNVLPYRAVIVDEAQDMGRQAFQLIRQMIPGGGQIGTEFPLMIQLAYRDAEGNDRNWYHGFYYVPPPGNYILYNEADNSSESINQFLWYPYESKNLLTTLGPAKPVYIKYIRVYASGWIYDTMVTDIQLLAQD